MGGRQTLGQPSPAVFLTHGQHHPHIQARASESSLSEANAPSDSIGARTLVAPGCLAPASGASTLAIKVDSTTSHVSPAAYNTLGASNDAPCSPRTGCRVLVACVMPPATAQRSVPQEVVSSHGHADHVTATCWGAPRAGSKHGGHKGLVLRVSPAFPPQPMRLTCTTV
jgi:hypothetical protein